MEETQQFRLIGTTDIMEIPVSHVGEQNIVYWVDIKQVFKDVEYVKNGKVAVNMLKDQIGNNIEPPRIKHFPGVVLDVVTSIPPSTISVAESSFQEYMVEKVDGLTVTSHEIKNMVAEALENQKLMQDRLALIQQKAEAILVQNYELFEYTIPRLFIVLPETSVSWDPATIVRTKFRLHFICECGEHTKVPGSTFPNHLHLAKHEGYVINKPTEFFRKYGPFLMTMLHLIKVGTGIAGHVVPALANLKVVDIIDSTLSAVDSVTKDVIEGVDYSIKYLEENSTQIQKSNGVDIDGNEVALRNLGSYLARIEGLEGVDLRQLGSYLKANSSDNLLGNLYRITTDKGHVKWVCIDHYRQAYKEKDQQDFEKAVQVNGGSYDLQLGKVVISLESRIRAEEFFVALTKARRVDNLDIKFNWECGRKDLEALEEALKKSRISILRLDLQEFRTSLGRKLLATSTQYETLFHIMELPNTKKVHVVLPKELVRLSDFKPKGKFDLHKLSCEMVAESMRGKEFETLVETLKTSSILVNLNLSYNSIGPNGARVLSDALKASSTLTTLDLYNNSIGDNGAQVLSDALKTNSTLTTLNLEANSIGSNGAQAL
ncbi:hypothetical protein BGX20_003917, partial [Mortierella sp. AD010]